MNTTEMSSWNETAISWNETWKKFRPVPGFEPIYKISAIGKSVSGLQRFMYWLLNAF